MEKTAFCTDSGLTQFILCRRRNKMCEGGGGYKIKNFPHFKGIVSRDWGGLLMILLGRLEVFNISASRFFYFCRRFRTVILKMVA